MYLADTSVWIDYLRGEARPHVQVLRGLLAGEDPVGISPPILQEILQGADSMDRFRKWERRFADLWCYVPLDPVQTYVDAARLYQACRQAGHTPRSSNDCLVACTALEHGLILIHNDRDFDLIGRVEKRLRLYPMP